MFPEPPIVLDPRRRIPHRPGHQPAVIDAPIFLPCQQPCVFQDAHVLQNGGKGNIKRFCQLYDGELAASQASQNGAAGGIGQRPKRSVERRR